MTDLVEWLRQQLNEDEREIRKHPDVPFEHEGLLASEETGYPAQPILLISKRRALAELEAKRQIVDRSGLYAPDLLRLLALPYADRPGYDESWRP